MSPYAVAVVLALGVVIGRVSRRREFDTWVRNPKLWYSLAAFVLAANAMVATLYIIGSSENIRAENRLLRGEQDCGP